MEWPRGMNMIYSCGGDLLCTLHRAKGLYGYWGYMRVSPRLKSKSGSSSHTGGGSVQGRAALLYILYDIQQMVQKCVVNISVRTVQYSTIHYVQYTTVN